MDYPCPFCNDCGEPCVTCDPWVARAVEALVKPAPGGGYIVDGFLYPFMHHHQAVEVAVTIADLKGLK